MNRLILWRVGVTVSFSLAFIISSFMFITSFIEIIEYLKIIDHIHLSPLIILFSTLLGVIGAPLIWNTLSSRAS